MNELGRELTGEERKMNAARLNIVHSDDGSEDEAVKDDDQDWKHGDEAVPPGTSDDAGEQQRPCDDSRILPTVVATSSEPSASTITTDDSRHLMTMSLLGPYPTPHEKVEKDKGPPSS